MGEPFQQRRAAILAVGNEVVQGFIVNSNAAWLAQELGELGFDVAYHLALLDRQEELERRLKAALAEGLLIICTGGIGPTEDDRTRQAVAAALNLPLELDHQELHTLHERYSQLGRSFPKGSEIQCMAPKGAALVRNAFGTASCFFIKRGGGGVACLPGVPREMKGVWREELRKVLVDEFGLGARFFACELKCFGLPESEIDLRVRHLLTDGGKHAVEGAILVDDAVIRLRWRLSAKSQAEADAVLAPVVAEARKILGDVVFADGDVSLEHATVELLREKKLRVALAESCTGGMIAHLITQVPGSSDVLIESAVTYANEAKQRRLGVKGETLSAHGAVSEQTVREMAEGIKRESGADLTVADSGIAGPGGGSEGKPVGTVWLAASMGGETKAWRMLVPGDRELVKWRAARTAINVLRLAALHGKLPDKPTHFVSTVDSK
ncbi:MAG: CinA family nicotinamide mononucleotide deamidase-related protein [Planctomycetes bacterium]|nr:CinA family nicotinamide mononucleotide deamidase-related protein [Planctomycetota bacterium]